MIKMPPMISPQRTLLSSINAASTSANGLRGGFKTGGGFALSESFAHSPNLGAVCVDGWSVKVAGVMNGGFGAGLSAPARRDR